MSKKCKTTFILKEFYENKSIEWNLHVDSTPGPHHYDMILGHDVMSKLRITLDFKDQTMTWDDSTINMKDPESFPDLLDPVNDFFWNNDQYETEALQYASARLQKILDAKYAPADLNEVVLTCGLPLVSRKFSKCEVRSGGPRQGRTDVRTSMMKKCQLHALLSKYKHLFDGTLGTWHKEPYTIELKEGVKPYHSRPFPVPKIHEHTLKVELDRLVKLGVLK